MPKLPDLNAFGARPTPEPGLSVTAVSGKTGAETAVGETLMKTGATLVTFGEQVRAQQTQEERERKAEQEKLDRTRAEDATNALRERQLDLTMGEQNGFMRRRGQAAIDPALPSEYEKRWSDAVKEVEGTLTTPRQKELFKQRADVSRMQFQQDLLRHRLSEDTHYRKQVFESTVDVETRAATSSWQTPANVEASLVRINAAIRDAAEGQGWSPEVVTAMQQKAAAEVHRGVIGQALAAEQTTYAKNWFEKYKDQIDPNTAKALFKQVEDETQKTLFNGYQRVFIDNGNDRRTLAALERQVNADTKLDESRKNILLGRIASKVETLDRRAEMAQMRWERNIERQISAVNNITLQGFEPTAEQMAPLVAATKGTAFEPQVRQMIATAETTRQFRLASPREQETMLTQMEQAARRDPTKFDLQALSRFRTIYEGQQKMVRDDPISFATRQGLVSADDPAARPLDMSKPELLGPQLTARAALARGMSSRYGAPVKVLTKEESDAMVSAFRTASASDKQKYLGALSRGLGDDPQAYRAVLAQIAPDDPVTAIAGAKAADNARDPRGRAVGELMLRGQEILNPPKKQDGSPAGGKLWPMPKPEDMQSQFRSIEQDAMKGQPRMRSDMQQAVFAIYAAKTAEAGDTTGVVDSKRMRESFEAAIGGVQRWNGSYTIIPAWSSPGQFRDGVKSSLDAMVASGQLDAETAKRAYDAPLELAGEGRYKVRIGDAILSNKQGQDIVIDLSAAGRVPMLRAGGTLGETAGGAVTGRAR